jgi:hypothetical protein
MKNELTFVIIASPNDYEIIDCIESINDLGKIVIVDGGLRTDKEAKPSKQIDLKELSSKVKATYIFNKFRFAAEQYNLGINSAETEWIFILDSDEKITLEMEDWLRNNLNKTSKWNSYSILRINYFLNKPMKHGQFRPDRNIRIFKKNFGRYEDREVHARLITTGEVGKCEVPILHFTVKNLDDFFLRMMRYSDLELMAREKQNSSNEVKAILRSIIIKLPFQPTVRFFYSYVIRLGFMDGRLGFLLAKSAAFYETMVLLRKETKLED